MRVLKASARWLSTTSTQSVRKSVKLPAKPALPTHNDISSFLEYAQQVKLSPISTVFHGNLFEYTVLRALTRRVPHVSLSKSGGRDDLGIDLFGTWTLPTATREAFPLLVSCKAEAKTRGPVLVRELDGVLTGKSMTTMGIIASIGECTPGMRKAILASRQPVGFVKVTPLEIIVKEVVKQGRKMQTTEEETENGETGDKKYTVQFTGKGGLLQQFVWNAAANRMLQGFGVTLKHIPTEENYLEQEIALMYKGMPLPEIDSAGEAEFEDRITIG